MSKRDLPPNSINETNFKKIKSANEENERVILFLDNQASDQFQLQKLNNNYLREKMSRISSSTRKYFENSFKINDDFIPIEYYHDGGYVFNLFDALRRKGKEVSLFHRDIQFKFSPLLLQSEEGVMNLQFLDKLLEVNGTFINRAPKEYSFDKEVIRKVMKTYVGAYYMLPQELKNDKELALLSIENNPNLSSFLPNHLKSDKEIFMKIIQDGCYNGQAFGLASYEIRSDREITLQHVAKFPKSIREAAEELQSDRDFILQCIKMNGMVIEFIDKKFLFDREIIVEAVKYRASPESKKFPIDFAPNSFKSNREIILSSVSHSGASLKSVSIDFKSDREIVLAAVKQNGEALEYASSALKNDREIVSTAIQKCASSIRFASSGLKKDRELVMQAIKQDGTLLFFFEHFQDDREMVLEALRNNGSLEYASEEIEADREIVLEAIRINTTNLDYASEELRSDKEIVLEAIILESKKEAEPFVQPFIYATEELQNDKEFVIQVVQIDGSSLQFASEELQNDIDVIKNVRVGRITSPELYGNLSRNFEFVKQIAKQNFKLVIDFVYENNPEITAIGLEHFGYFSTYSKQQHYHRLSVTYPELEHVEKYYQIRY
ncbi:hypothetical protein NAEGRDRAFT_75016 [Naegleria gruberi]|uniref:DUF4116 domain-containing protein n=1 Tax=Naegleria gruberi TaxID=5762 RepID=D2W0X8_NAEGR|nr:uncharacterized protein NAEGRDRAFT_75016 [Naegleria gruberi]EFC37257.1 hypothetical protein NAEGRDRAFT_75016 [Naegleria gruberi]|eukprot:XP_002670001.1 hypothetical protein NAEGRDRAFT_75016 [Naegleria gruberi strain NEG-M]